MATKFTKFYTRADVLSARRSDLWVAVRRMAVAMPMLDGEIIDFEAALEPVIKATPTKAAVERAVTALITNPVNLRKMLKVLRATPLYI